MHCIEADETTVETLTELWYMLATEMEAHSDLNELVYSSVDEVSEDGFRRQLESDSVSNVLLQESGETIGFLTLSEGTHPSREYSEYLKLINLFVKPEHRNQGYGTEAVEWVKERAVERGCDHLKVSFEVNNNGARRFYRRHGFEEKQIESVYRLEFQYGS